MTPAENGNFLVVVNTGK